MNEGIVIFGCNGGGKSTLGRLRSCAVQRQLCFNVCLVRASEKGEEYIYAKASFHSESVSEI